MSTGSTSSIEYAKEFKCKKCNKKFIKLAKVEDNHGISAPFRCSFEGCFGHSFQFVRIVRDCDYQEVKIQDKVSQITVGSVPRSMTIILLDDLVDVCKAGDEITVLGVLGRRWEGYMTKGFRPRIQNVILGNNIIINEDKGFDEDIEELENSFEKFWEFYKNKPFKGRDKILKSVCPQLFGMFVVKLALILTLIGGIERETPDGHKTRGRCHLLLCGDPGTGKSQFLKYACKLHQRSVLTTGTGSTSAGLTVMAKKEKGSNNWMLEAGALVLADQGICCIDEFDSIKPHDRSTIHEAMEQQTLSIAKAGLVCKLNTRASVIAACNPKGKYDVNSSLSLNTAIETPLLSRFDLIIVLLDCVDEQWDLDVADFVLNQQECLTNEDNDELNKELFEKKIWDLKTLKNYISYVKGNLTPNIPKNSQDILQQYWTYQRFSDYQEEGRATTRLLESLIRLSQAHARLMYRNTVEIDDAIMACIIMDSSMNQNSILNVESVLHGKFPQNPDKSFTKDKNNILRTLKLSSLISNDDDSDDDNSDDEDSNDVKMKENENKIDEDEEEDALMMDKTPERKQTQKQVLMSQHIASRHFTQFSPNFHKTERSQQNERNEYRSPYRSPKKKLVPSQRVSQINFAPLLNQKTQNEDSFPVEDSNVSSNLCSQFFGESNLHQDGFENRSQFRNNLKTVVTTQPTQPEKKIFSNLENKNRYQGNEDITNSQIGGFFEMPSGISQKKDSNLDGNNQNSKKDGGFNIQISYGSIIDEDEDEDEDEIENFDEVIEKPVLTTQKRFELIHPPKIINKRGLMGYSNANETKEDSNINPFFNLNDQNKRTINRFKFSKEPENKKEDKSKEIEIKKEQQKRVKKKKKKKKKKGSTKKKKKKGRRNVSFFLAKTDEIEEDKGGIEDKRGIVFNDRNNNNEMVDEILGEQAKKYSNDNRKRKRKIILEEESDSDEDKETKKPLKKKKKFF